MSHLSRFMSSARAILDEQDQQRLAPNPNQPPVFVRTNWLFVEIDEAMAVCASLAAAIKTARLELDVSKAALLNAELGRKLRQTVQLSYWAHEQFQREGM